jgi:hypothetical protein
MRGKERSMNNMHPTPLSADDRARSTEITTPSMTPPKPAPSPRRLFAFSPAALALWLCAAVLLGLGCSEERNPIDRTQPGILAKRFFVGQKLLDPSDDPEFYMRTTVVDVQAGAGSESLFTNSDAQPTVRIRWELSEKQLIARLAYEVIDGTDGKGISKKASDGQVVAAFAVEKHLDIRREYNAATGEEANVVVENDVDRSWYDRAYVRVDFSKNLISSAYDFDTFSQLGLFGAVAWESLQYVVNEKDEEDRLHVEGDSYLDVTVKAQAKPQMINDPDFGSFPACYLLDADPRESCNPSEVKLRLSWKRVVDNDYEAVDFDGNRMEMFGYFTNDRRGYDRKFGLVDNQWHRFASRWNIWKASHKKESPCFVPEFTPAGKSPHRDEDDDGTEDECSDVGQGSRCDEFKQLCTLPYAVREVRTIPWYVNSGYPESLFEAGKKVIHAWNQSMRGAVVAARVAECRRTKGDDCESRFGFPNDFDGDFEPPSDKVPDVFVLCHNPSDPSKDPEACGKGISPRIGDLRYNLFSLIRSPQLQSPWGIMVDSEDPLTGEKVAGSVNQWEGTLDRAAANLVEIVNLLNGLTPSTDLIEGKDVRDWIVRASEAPKAMSANEQAERLNAFDPQSISHLATASAKEAARAQRLPPRQRFRERAAALAANGMGTPGNAAVLDRMKRLQNTPLEAKLVTPEFAQLAGKNGSAHKLLNDALSPTRAFHPRAQKRMRDRREHARAKRHACFREGPEVDHMLSLARTAKTLFPLPDANDGAAVRDYKDKLFAWAKERFFIGVQSHEFGHSVGLRHNFAGTFDAMNFGEEYWQLRTHGGKVLSPCAEGNTNGESCIGPRWKDPLTQGEINGNIGAYASSTVMDYPGDAAVDMLLLGKYDRAAVRFGYGGTVDVWAAPGLTVKGNGDGKRKAFALTGHADPPGLFGVASLPLATPTDTSLYGYEHYSNFAREYDLVKDCAQGGNLETGVKCKQPKLDVVDYRDLKPFTASRDYPEFTTTERAVDSTGRPRHGYMFSSDEYADSGNVPSFRNDAGADPYEQARFLESAYENRYLFDYFRRNRSTFNAYDVVLRTQARYLDQLQAMSKTFGFAMVLENPNPATPDPKLFEDGRYKPLSLAASLTFELLARTMVRPEPGRYCSPEQEDCFVPQPVGLNDWIFSADASPSKDTKYNFNIPLGTGRFLHNDFDYSQGYHWGDYPKQVGSFYDKVYSVYYLAEAFDSFIANSKEDFVDGRYKNINFATFYPDQVRRLFAQVLTGDIPAFAPWTPTVKASASPGDVGVTYPPFLTNLAAPRGPSSAILDPGFGFNAQLYAMVWGTMLFPTSYTQDFMNSTRMVASAAEQINWPANQTATFFDPETGITYRAHAQGKESVFGVQHERGIGARMLEWANDLVASAYVVETDADGNVVKNPDGTPKLKLKAGKPEVNSEFPEALSALRKYVTNIEVMRQLNRMFEGPFSGNLPQ